MTIPESASLTLASASGETVPLERYTSFWSRYMTACALSEVYSWFLIEIIPEKEMLGPMLFRETVPLTIPTDTALST